MATHELKTDTVPFAALWEGTKRFEYRRNDRGGYRAGDMLRLREYDAVFGEYSGREIQAYVTYVLGGGEYEVPVDYCIMSLHIVSRHEHTCQYEDASQHQRPDEACVCVCGAVYDGTGNWLPAAATLAQAAP